MMADEGEGFARDEMNDVARDGRRAAAKKTCLLIAGMHRSGTSALARTCALLGAALPAHVIPGRPNDNEAGFWEARAVVDLNQAILESAGSTWDDWAAIHPDWFRSAAAEQHLDDAQDVLNSEFGAARQFVLKDPRICRLLPFWKRALSEFGAEPLVVSILRNPIDVTASLLRRNQMDAAETHLFWLRHVLDAEVHARDLPRVFVHYDDLLADWRPVTDRIAQELGFAWSRRSASADMEIDAFLSPSLRHHQAPDASLESDTRASPLVKRTYQILCAWARDGERLEDHAALDEIRRNLDELTPFFARVGVQARTFRKRVRELEKQSGQRQQKLAEAEQKHAGELAAERDKRAAAEADRARKETEISEAIAKLEVRDAQVERLSKQLEAREQSARSAKAEVERVGGELARVTQELAQVRSALAQRGHEAEQTAGELKRARADLEALAAQRAEDAAKAEEAQRQLAEQRAQLEVATGELAKITDFLSQAEAARAEIAGQLTAARSEASERAEALANATRAHEQAVAQLGTANSEIAQLTEMLGKAEADRARIEGEMRELRASIAEERARSGLRAREVAALTGSLREKDDAAGELDALLSRLFETTSPLERMMPARAKMWRRIARLQKSGLFDADWYLAAYNDVAADPRARRNPMRHFVQHGWKEGRAPNAAFAKLSGAHRISSGD